MSISRENWSPVRVFVEGAGGEEQVLKLWRSSGSLYRLKKRCEQADVTGVLTLWNDIGEEVNIPWRRVIAAEEGGH